MRAANTVITFSLPLFCSYGLPSVAVPPLERELSAFNNTSSHARPKHGGSDDNISGLRKKSEEKRGWRILRRALHDLSVFNAVDLCGKQSACNQCIR